MPIWTRTHAAVSVVVPVYNPGVSIDVCIESLLTQSLPADQVEIIFVDDGSTDGTGARLDQLASAYANVRVIHQPNSGWAGKPRNVGVRAARGTYVQFVDQDDALGPEALERLTGYADANDADIVIGKVTSNFRTVPHDLWAVNVAHCSIHTAPLIESLTPHKMFRRSFLRAHKLRFPEGPRRLEDQHFMAAAYFATERVAILGDYPCYFYNARPDGENAGGAEVDPVAYYGNLREVLEIIEANTVPGAFRDSLLRRFLQLILRRINGAATNDELPHDYVAALFREARTVTLEYFPDSVRDGLPTLRRYRATALVADRLDIVAESGRRSAEIGADVSIERPVPTDNGWRLHMSAQLVHADGEPVIFHPEGDAWRLDPRLAAGDLAMRSDTTDEIIHHAAAVVSLRERESAVEWPTSGPLLARLEPIEPGNTAYRLVFEGDVDIDPATIAGGSRLDPGIWRLMVRVRALGIARISQLMHDNVEEVPPVSLRRPRTIARLRHAGDSTRLVVAVKRQGAKVDPVRTSTTS